MGKGRAGVLLTGNEGKLNHECGSLFLVTTSSWNWMNFCPPICHTKVQVILQVCQNFVRKFVRAKLQVSWFYHLGLCFPYL